MFNQTNPLAPIQLKSPEKIKSGLADFVVGLGTEFTEKRTNTFAMRNKSYVQPGSSRRSGSNEPFEIKLGLSRKDGAPSDLKVKTDVRSANVSPSPVSPGKRKGAYEL